MKKQSFKVIKIEQINGQQVKEGKDFKIKGNVLTILNTELIPEP